MQIGSAFNTSLAGLQKASEGISQTSHKIASESLPQQREALQSKAEEQSLAENANREPITSTTDKLTSLLEQRNAASANIKALQTTDEVIGKIIDLKA
ncbi:hypothetical protein C2869_11305 [Saccharobesus litoralis]|uniref:Uncharacterized protein n=1 Tax=Saccharobesus litoralis TaxID=2172099 RepID=A0A2S0VRZ7_9ALTE|nr:hypothetical protein [Saccharobesus litoralis]AWB66988.1 hypothetical protein C2869_11305 [Saccharobesus litoralis]